jgi:hypothetical protein
VIKVEKFEDIDVNERTVLKWTLFDRVIIWLVIVENGRPL